MADRIDILNRFQDKKGQEQGKRSTQWVQIIICILFYITIMVLQGSANFSTSIIGILSQLLVIISVYLAISFIRTGFLIGLFLNIANVTVTLLAVIQGHSPTAITGTIVSLFTIISISIIATLVNRNARQFNQVVKQKEEMVALNEAINASDEELRQQNDQLLEYYQIIKKSEEALDREYNLLRAVIDNVPEQIYAHDVDGNYLLNNLCDARMIGVDNPEDLQGKSDFDYYPPDLAADFYESEKRVIESGQAIVDVEEVITRADGKQHWILTTKTPLRDRQGQITGIVGVTRDITERKQRERELEVIVTMSHALRSAETSTNLLVMIYNQVINLLHVDFGTLELIDPANGDAEVVYSFGAEGQLDGMRIPPTKGVNTHIRASNKPYLDNNITENPMALDFLVSTGCTAVAGAPMIAEEELIGFLWIGRKSAITEDELRILSAIADIAASSIRRITLHELTEKRLQQLLSLRKIDTSINSSKELDATLGVLLDQTRTQLQVDAADILLCNKDMACLHFELGMGFTSNLFDHPIIRMGDGPAGMAAQTRQMIQIQNLAELGPEHPLARASQAEGFVSYFVVPLLVRDEIKGVLEVFLRRQFNPDREWVNFLETLAGQAAIAIEQVQLFEGLQRSNQELVKAYDQTIEGWVKALDLRDEETEGHSLRVSQLCTDLATAMGIGGEELVHIYRGALLHDIGKVGVPDHILLKPGKLTDEEWVIMRRHPVLAREMLSPISYLLPALDIPYCHHERWDGAGYPRGLKEEDIPLAARIFSVVDVWDALSSDRPYRKAWPTEEVLKYLKEQAGSQFDPAVVKTFLRMV